MWVKITHFEFEEKQFNMKLCGSLKQFISHMHLKTWRSWICNAQYANCLIFRY